MFNSHGPVIELSLASEALGLARSLNWEIEDGPQRHELAGNESDKEANELDDSAQIEKTYNSDSEEIIAVKDDILGENNEPKAKRSDQYKRKPMKKSRDGQYLFDINEAQMQKKEENIKDGDYVYTVAW